MIDRTVPRPTTDVIERRLVDSYQNDAGIGFRVERLARLEPEVYGEIFEPFEESGLDDEKNQR